MKFKRLKIVNFRNFEDIEIELSNKNIVFGMNDSGKTNMLYALRFLFDRSIRNQGLVESDYYKNDTSVPIEIIVEIDLENPEESEDSQFLISSAKEARNSEEFRNVFFVKLEAEFDDVEFIGIPQLSWGSELNNLVSVKNIGNYKTVLDDVFEVNYIPSSVHLESTYKKNRKYLFDNQDKTDDDLRLECNIESNIKDLNTSISQLTNIINIEEDLTREYKKFRREDIDIKIESEISISGYHNNLVPYIKLDKEDQNNYPTSGDGRKKILSFALENLVYNKFDRKRIRINLIEEPENHLHRTLQLSLSKQLFNDDIYKYFFMTTHSPNLLIQMDNTQLIRIWTDRKSFSESYLYKVEDDFNSLKLKLNKDISEAVFSDVVLLVEGPSEKILFESILQAAYPNFEIEGKYILSVDGIGFKKYVEILKSLNIKYFIKTDNDIRIRTDKDSGKKSIEYLGINRALAYCENVDENKLENIETVNLDDNSKNRYKIKKDIFVDKKPLVSQMKESNVYLSEVDLENDFYELLPQQLKDKFEDKENFVKKLQKKKKYNMVDLINEINHEQFVEIFDNSTLLKNFVDN